MRWLLAVVGVLVLTGGGVWLAAGRMPGPQVQIQQPVKFVGQSSPLEVTVTSPGGRLSRLDVSIEQNGQRHDVFTLGPAGQASPALRHEGADRVSITARVGKHEILALQSGTARLLVQASRPVLYGLRQASSESVRDLNVRLEAPRVEVLSMFQYVNQGGAEFVVYRATPSDVESGVRVGDLTYTGFPGAGVGIKAGDTRVAFFALLHNQDPGAPMTVYARDAAGNEAVAPLDHRVFPKPFAHSRIEIDDRFLQRVVPAIASATPDMALSTAPPDLVASFLKINGDLRRRNDQTLIDLSQKTTPEMIWKEAFQPLGNAKVEAKFADSRTYMYQGKEIDHQVHLGFDLAVTMHIPVVASNRGVVVYAGNLGIYGNCIVLDHGLGVQSLYGHLSAIDVKVGQTVNKGQEMGRSGMTGLAGGDHLHFTMLVDGHPVNPVEWWDPKWMQDRVFRKISAAGGSEGR
jgi:murein DD-endopeptidase MepM/ murein hydrolase activator NlpD